MKKRISFNLFCLFFVVGCASSMTTVISVQEANCRSCLDTLKGTFEKIEGVENVSLNFFKLETTVKHNDAVTDTMLLAKCNDSSINCVLGKGKGSYKRTVEFSKGCDVAWLTHKGEAIDVNASLVSGKITVVDFYADWCGPCRNVDEMMADYLEDHSDQVAFRKINIVDWDTPAAVKYLKKVAGLPYAMVFNKHGKLVKKLVSFSPESLYKLLETLREQK